MWYRAKIHQKILENIAKTKGKSTVRLMAQILSMEIDAKTEEEFKVIRWAKKNLSAEMQKIRPKQKTSQEEPGEWSF